MKTIIGILSSDSKSTATKLGLSFVRNRVTWDKSANNGVKQMTAPYGYLTNINSSSGYLPTDMIAYGTTVANIISSMPVKPALIVIENEVLVKNKAAAYVPLIQTVKGITDIPIATSGTVMPVVNEITRRWLFEMGRGDEAISFKKRNYCSSSASKVQNALDEISLLTGLNLDIWYNFHYQLKDAGYEADFKLVAECLTNIWGDKLVINEIAVRTTDAATASAAGRCCKMFSFSAFYNMVGGSGNAKILSKDGEAAFMAALM